MEALDEEQLDQGAWDENVLDMEGAGSEDDVEAVGNEYEGGDEDDEGGWEMEVRRLYGEHNVKCYLLPLILPMKSSALA